MSARQRIATLVGKANVKQEEILKDIDEVQGVAIVHWPIQWIEALCADKLGWDGVDSVYVDAAGSMQSDNWTRCSFILFMLATLPPHYLVNWIVARKGYLADGGSARDIAGLIKKYYTGAFNGHMVIDMQKTIEARKKLGPGAKAVMFPIDRHYDAGDDEDALTYCAYFPTGRAWFPKPHVDYMLAAEDMKQWAKVLDGQLTESAFRRAPYPNLNA